jgi:site-specific recombinase XerD
MTPLRQQMMTALELSGKSQRTQQSDVREVRLLATFYNKSPHLISEAELRRYLLHRKNKDRLAPSSMRICYSGIRFFYRYVIERDWKLLDLIRAQAEQRLPAILSAQEVRQLLSMATPLHNRVYFTPIYHLGLRLQEGLFLQVSDIDGQRLMVHVHRGKGAKDRYVPLPCDTLALLRHYWTTHRHPIWLFPATGRDQKQRASAPEPMSRSSEGAFRKAKQRAGIIKHDVGIHTLRHC